MPKKGQHHTEETRKKISLARIGKHWSKEMKKKFSLSNKGQVPWNKGKVGVYSKERLIQLSNQMKGNSLFKNKHHTKETISKLSGNNNGNWNGGKFIDGSGYVLILKPKHPFATKQGYVKRSHLVIEKNLDRYLKPDEVVHHINEIRDDDRIENLRLFKNKSEHSKFHFPKGKQVASLFT